MILADTSFIVAYLNTQDSNHSRALQVKDAIDKGTYGRLVISDYVYGECMTVLRLKLKDAKILRSYRSALKKMIAIHVDELLFEQTDSLFIEQRKLSFVDCSIVAVMRHERIVYLATFDKGFDGITGVTVV